MHKLKEVSESEDLNKIISSIVSNLKILKSKFPKKSNIISAYYNYFILQNFLSQEQALNNFI
jgi:hypothetical protein